MSMKFEKATKKKLKLRLALAGPSGSGKTLSALLIAKGLGGKTAVADTERKSASLYADHPLLNGWTYDVGEVEEPYSPEHFIEIIKSAETAGYANLILDSTTYEWNGVGGVLDIVNTLARTKFRGNSYAAWEEGTPRHRAFLDAMLQSKINIIATMRSKSAYVEGEKNGKKTYTKVGMAPEQRDGIEYEFTVFFDVQLDGHFALASKDRTDLFKDPEVLSEKTGHKLLGWLQRGIDAPEPVKPSPSAQLQDEIPSFASAPTLEQLYKEMSHAIRHAMTEEALNHEVLTYAKTIDRIALENPAWHQSMLEKIEHQRLGIVGSAKKRSARKSDDPIVDRSDMDDGLPESMQPNQSENLTELLTKTGAA